MESSAVSDGNEKLSKVVASSRRLYISHSPTWQFHVTGLFASTPVLSRRRQFRIPQNTNWQWRSRKFSFFSPDFLVLQVPTTVLMTQTAENRRDAAQILSVELG